MSTARAAGLGDQEERAGGGLHQEKLDEDERLPAEIGERMGLVTRGDGGTSDGEDLHTRRHSWLVRHDRWEARAWRRLGSGQSQKPKAIYANRCNHERADSRAAATPPPSRHALVDLLAVERG
jgi:hypothetical protein